MEFSFVGIQDCHDNAQSDALDLEPRSKSARILNYFNGFSDQTADFALR
jgi:hypothetical protein